MEIEMYWRELPIVNLGGIIKSPGLIKFNMVARENGEIIQRAATEEDLITVILLLAQRAQR